MLKGLYVFALLKLSFAGLLWRFDPKRQVHRDKVYLPIISGINLKQQAFVFPRDFKSDFNLIFITFLQQQQEIVNTWLPFVQKIEADYPSTAYYTFMIIDEMPSPTQSSINEKIQSHPDEHTVERTVILYIDTQSFMQSMNIQNKNDVHILLIDGDGEILWRSTNGFDEKKGAHLLQKIQPLE